jgi:hypothetical protein
MDDLDWKERDLLAWLGEEEFSQYGECYGPTLDALIAKGLAKVNNGKEYQNGFIAKGNGPMYQAVSLTDVGRKTLNQ